jgi:phosphoglycolate phosphatase
MQMTSFPFDIVGFDLDGTLLDSHGDLAAAVNHAIALEGRAAIPAADVRSLVGGGARKMLTRALEVTGGPVPETRFETLHATLLEFYEANIAVQSRLFPGGEEMLDGLAARGVRIAVVTNKLERFAVRIFEELGLSDRFYTVIGGDTLGPGRAKPRPDLLFEMLARAGVVRDSARAVYVGDTTYDTGAAAAAGLPCVVVSFGFCDKPPRELGANAVIDHFDQLIPALDYIGTASVR